jgi:hypothetical protein
MAGIQPTKPRAKNHRGRGNSRAAIRNPQNANTAISGLKIQQPMNQDVDGFICSMPQLADALNRQADGHRFNHRRLAENLRSGRALAPAIDENSLDQLLKLAGSEHSSDLLLADHDFDLRRAATIWRVQCSEYVTHMIGSCQLKCLGFVGHIPA